MPAIDTSNYYPLLRDGHLPELEISDLTESEWVQQHLGRPVLKVFNNILAAHLEHNGKPAGKPGCIFLLVAGDEATAKQQAIALLEELGFARPRRKISCWRKVLSCRQPPGQLVEFLFPGAPRPVSHPCEKHSLQRGGCFVC